MTGYVRHEWIDTFCGRLHDILIGEAAARVLEARTGATGTVLVLPTWAWVVPAIDIGRKALRRDGRAMLMPVRLTWDGGPVRILRPGTVTVADWSMIGMGHSACGRMDLDETLVRARAVQAQDAAPVEEPSLSSVRLAPGRDVTHALHALIEAGKHARWEATMALEAYVERAVTGAVRVVSADILHGLPHAQAAPDVLDETGLEQVRDRMLLGTSEREGAVALLLRRCLAPVAFVRVDPLKYITTDLRRAAELYVRQAVGDPPIGRKVRRVWRELPEATLEQLIATYNERHPADDLSVKRALRALTAGRDAMAGAHDLERLGTTLGDPNNDTEALALAHLESQDA
ncbi:hypothetical protein [Pseudactinotalea terrae]|uniref:hypothetical protein n=1 Tax=Pseudactinotalea terrae TaxID=1743262 RepID=UPI0012E23B5A|nr:hypothetical protein [Pseudactinotalea terrae]